MTKEEAIRWAGTPEAGERVWAIVQRWQEAGYEPSIRLTRRGDLAIEVGIMLSEAEEPCDIERPAEGKTAPLLPPE